MRLARPAPSFQRRRYLYDFTSSAGSTLSHEHRTHTRGRTLLRLNALACAPKLTTSSPPSSWSMSRAIAWITSPSGILLCGMQRRHQQRQANHICGRMEKCSKTRNKLQTTGLTTRSLKVLARLFTSRRREADSKQLPRDDNAPAIPLSTPTTNRIHPTHDNPPWQRPPHHRSSPPPSGGMLGSGKQSSETVFRNTPLDEHKTPNLPERARKRCEARLQRSSALLAGPPGCSCPCRSRSAARAGCPWPLPWPPLRCRRRRRPRPVPPAQEAGHRSRPLEAGLSCRIDRVLSVSLSLDGIRFRG